MAKEYKGIRFDVGTIKEVAKLAALEDRSWSNMLEVLARDALRSRRTK